jgi:phage protein D
MISLDYAIKYGDALSEIALDYGMTWHKLDNYYSGTGKKNSEGLNEPKNVNGKQAKSMDNPNLNNLDDVDPDPDNNSSDEETAEQEAPESGAEAAVPDEGTPEPTVQPSPTPSSLMRPAYKVEIGSDAFSMKSGSGLVNLKVFRGTGLPTDSCEIFLVESEDYSFSKGDALKVELGYEDKLKPVFSGLVENIEHELSMIRVTALGLAIGLLRLRLNRVYLNQTAGKIVSNLAQEANLNVKTVSDGITLPMYVIDETINAYEHILKLGERCNFDAYISEDEKLVFKESGGGKNNTVQFGKDLVKMEAFDFAPLYGSVKVYGESPSSLKGSDTSHWLTKQEVKGEAGAGAVLSICDSCIKDNKTAETVAKARTNRLGYVLGAVVVTVGNPEIKLGDTLTVGGAPDSSLNGQLEVRSIEHYLSKVRGFTTVVNCWMRGP